MGGAAGARLNGVPPIDPEELAAEKQHVREAQYERHFAAHRNAAGLLSIGVGVVALVIASLIPEVATTLQLRPDVTIGTLALLMAFFGAATIASRRHGGPLGRAHRRIEFVETWVTALTGAAFVYGSGSALCIWWFIPVVQILANLPFQGLGHRETIVAIGTMNVLAAAGFAIDGQMTDALMSVVFVGILLFLMQTIAQWSDSLVEAEATQRIVQRELSAVLVQSERQRIARDLHDGLGAELGSLVWRARRLGVANQTEVEELEGEVLGLMGRLREYVCGLASTETELSELCHELRARLENQCRDRAALVLTSTGSGVVSAPVAEALCRCADEATRNALQHGGASRIEVLVKHDERGAALIVRDDGVGFAEHQARSGRGLPNMRERAAQCGGRFEVVESELGGAEVRVHIPRDAESPSSR